MAMNIRDKIMNNAQNLKMQTVDLPKQVSGAEQRTAKQQEAYRQITANPVTPQLNSQSTSRDVLGQIGTIYKQDPTYAQGVLNSFRQRQQDPTSNFYWPYNKATNPAISSIQSYGVDVSSGVNSDWVQRNAGLQNYYQFGDVTNTPQKPSKPGKKATQDQIAAYNQGMAAYNYYQIANDEQQSVNADTEWEAMQHELAYWAGRDDLNMSDDEIVEKVRGEMKSKYPTLYRMDESVKPGGVVLSLNRPVGYSPDNMYGAVWAARNKGGTGNADSDTILGAAGEGNQWQENALVRAKLNPSDSAFSPFSLGMVGLDDEGMLFNRNNFDQQWLDDNRWRMNSNDETERNAYARVAEAEDYTQTLESERDSMFSTIDEMMGAYYTDPDAFIETLYNNNDFSHLYELDDSMRTGKYKRTTRAVDYRRADVEEFIRKGCANQQAAKTPAGTVAEAQEDLTGVPSQRSEAAAAEDQHLREVIGSFAPIIYKFGTAAENMAFQVGADPNYDALAQTLAQTEVNPEAAIASTSVEMNTETANSYLANARKIKEYNDRMEALEAKRARIAQLQEQIDGMEIETPDAYGNDSGIDLLWEENNGMTSVSAHLGRQFLQDPPEGWETARRQILQGDPAGYVFVNNWLGEPGREQAFMGSDDFNEIYMENKYDPRILQLMSFANALAEGNIPEEGTDELTQNELDSAWEYISPKVALQMELRDNTRELENTELNLGKYDNTITPVRAQQAALRQSFGIVSDIFGDDSVNSGIPDELDLLIENSGFVPTEWTDANPWDSWSDSEGDGTQTREERIQQAVPVATQTVESNLALATRLEEALAYADENGLELVGDERRNIERRVAQLRRDAKDAAYFLLSNQANFDEVADAAMEQGVTEEMSPLTRMTVTYLTGGDRFNGDTMAQLASGALGNNSSLEFDEFQRQFFTPETMMTVNLESRESTINHMMQLISPVEKKRYFYLLSEEGEEAANEYFQHLVNEQFGHLTTRESQARNEEITQGTANASFLERMLIGAARFAVKPIANLESWAAAKYQQWTGKEINPDSLSHRWSDLSSDTQEGLTQGFVSDLKNIFGNNVDENVARFFANVFFSAGDSAINSVMTSGLLSVAQTAFPVVEKLSTFLEAVADNGGVLGFGAKATSDLIHAMPMAMGAAGETYREWQRKGATPDQLNRIYATTLWAESMTEAITVGNIRDMWAAGKEGTKSFFRELFSNGFEEACGEGFNEWWEQNAEHVIMEGMSGWDETYQRYLNSGVPSTVAAQMADKEVFRSVMLSAAAGFVSSAGTSTVSYVGGRVVQKHADKQDFINTKVKDISLLQKGGHRKTGNAMRISAVLQTAGENAYAAAAAGKQLAGSGEYDANILRSTMEGVINATNVSNNTETKEAVTFAALTNGKSKEALNRLYWLTSRGNSITDDDVNALINAYHEDQQSDEQTQSFNNAVKEHRIAQKVVAATTSGDIAGNAINVAEKASRNALQKQNEYKAKHQRTQEAQQKVDAVSESLGAVEQEYDPSVTETAGALQQTTNELEGALNEKAQRQNEEYQARHLAQVAQQEAQQAGTAAVYEARHVAKQEVLQEDVQVVTQEAEQVAAEADQILGTTEQPSGEEQTEMENTTPQNPQLAELRSKLDAATQKLNEAVKNNDGSDQALQAVEAASDELRVASQTVGKELANIKRESENISDFNARAMADKILADPKYANLSETERQDDWNRLYRSMLGKNTSSALQRAVFANMISDKFGFDLVFPKTEEEFANISGQEAADAFWDKKNNRIVVNPNATYSDIMYSVLVHEMTHIAEQSDTYSDLADAILQMRYGDDVTFRGLLSAMESGDVSSREAQDVLARINRYNRYGVDLDNENALQEIVADAMGDIIFGEERQQLIPQLAEKNPSLARRILDAIKGFLRKLAGIENPTVTRAQEVVDMLENAIRDAEGKNVTSQPEGKYEINPIENESGEVLAAELPGGTEAKYSLSSWTTKEINTVRKNLLKNGFDQADIDQWIGDINSIAAVIAENSDRLDFTPDLQQKFKKPNGDVYKWTLDASTLCAKRLLYQGTFNAIQKLLPNTPLYAGDLIELSNMMREMGYQTPCGICYVESQRRDSGKFTEEFIKKYSQEHKGEFIPQYKDLTTSDGLYKLRDDHPEVYDAYIRANNARGSGSTKPVQLRTNYRGDVRSLTKDSIRYLKSIGGLRIQSFSDFETPHLMDMMQAVLDMSAVRLTSQAYTKVPNFAWVFGDTGIKINLSLMGEGTGVDANGNLVFSSTEGMDFDEAMRLRNRYSQNVGTILVGMNDAHILAAMADSRIDYIIPFHRSGWSEENRAKMTSLANYKDYQDFQNERDIKTGKKADANIEPGYVVNEDGTTDGYWDYNRTGKENAEAYLKLCAEKGLIPKFEQFLVNNGDGSYSLQPDGSTDGYWKLLIDFKMYDNNVVGAPQQAVTPNINMNQAYRVLDEFDGTGVNSLPVAQPVVDRFVEEYKKKHPLGKNNLKYSIPDESLNKRLLSAQEYARLQQNLNDKEFLGYKFQERPNGGNMVAMDNVIVYTDTNRMPEHVIRVNSDDVWMINDIQQEAMKLEEAGYGFDIQRDVLQSVYGEGCASFSSVRKYDAMQGETTGSSTDVEGSVRREDTEGVPDQRENNDSLNYSYSLPSDASYIESVNRGEMDEAQRIVKEVADAAGYTDKVYHGTDRFGFTSFNSEENGGQIFVSYYKKMAGTYATSDDADVRNVSEAIRLNKPVNELHGQELINAVMKYAPDADEGRIISIEMKPESSVRGHEEFTVTIDHADRWGDHTQIISDAMDLDLYDQINNAINKTSSNIYQLYARPGNQLVIDADSATWDEIPVPFSQGTITTREIGEWAKENGYDSVRINNVWDGGEGGSALDAYGDIGIFFKPKDVKSADTVTYDNNGNVIPPSERFNAGQNDIRYSLPSDAPYMAAVERGNMKEAQKLVDEAAQNAGYVYGKVYHGTPNNDFTEFRDGFIFFTSNKDTASEYMDPGEMWATNYKGGRTIGAYIRLENPLILDNSYSDYRNEHTPWQEWKPTAYGRVPDNAMNAMDVAERAKELGYDGVVIRNDKDTKWSDSGRYLKNRGRGDTVIAFSAEQIKSADPVTYDNEGNVIPLSERFNTSQRDFRYSFPSDEYLGDIVDEELNNIMNPAPEQTTAPVGPQRQFGSQTAQRSDEMYQEALDYLKANSGYIPDSNTDQLTRAIEWIRGFRSEADPDGYTTAVQKVTSKQFRYNSADSQARVLATMGMAVAKGDVNAQIQIADAFNKQGTALGQALQARKLFRLMTPAGRIQTLMKMLNDVKDRLGAKGINTDNIQLSTFVLQAAAYAEGEGEFELARKAAAQELGEQIPPNWREKFTAWRMLSMLSAPTTHIRNIMGNLFFMPFVGVKNKIGAVMELALPEGQRTKTLGLASQEARAFAKKDAKKIKTTLTGEAKYSEGKLIQQNRKYWGTKNGILSRTLGRAVQWAYDKNSWALEAEDWIFLQRHYRNALAGYMTANNLTEADMTGATLEKARAYAINEAQKATYRDANKVAAKLTEIGREGGAAEFLVNAVIPFKKTPANIMRRGVEYSPIGLMKSLSADSFNLKSYMDYQNGKTENLGAHAVSPQQYIDRVASGLTGLGIAAVGALLASLGAVRVGFDGDDDEFDQMAGEQEYSANLYLFGHNVNYTIDWAAPAAMPFFIGASIYDAFSERDGDVDVGRLFDSLLEVTEPVFNLSMLDGVNSLLKTGSYGDAAGTKVAQVGLKVLANYGTSYVPTVAGKIAKLVDPTRRKVYVRSGASDTEKIFGAALEQVENKIPWLSMSNIPSRNVWGEPEVTSTGWNIVQNFLSPGYGKEVDRDDPVMTELRRLYNATGDSAMVPKTAGKTVKAGGETIQLTAEQYDSLVVDRGQTAKNGLTELMARPEYQAADDNTRAYMIGQVWTYANQTANSHIDNRANMDTWVASAEREGNMVDAVIDLAVQRNIKDYQTKYKGTLIEAITDGNNEGATTSIAALRSTGMSDSSIRTYITKNIKPVYQAAYTSGTEQGDAEATRIASWLINSDFGYSTDTIEEWQNTAGTISEPEDEEEVPIEWMNRGYDPTANR